MIEHEVDENDNEAPCCRQRHLPRNDDDDVDDDRDYDDDDDVAGMRIGESFATPRRLNAATTKEARKPRGSDP